MDMMLPRKRNLPERHVIVGRNGVVSVAGLETRKRKENLLRMSRRILKVNTAKSFYPFSFCFQTLG